MKPHRLILAGPSCSGKTTLAEQYATITGIRLFRLDDFRRRVKRFVTGTDVRNYEHPDCWDGRTFAEALATCTGPFIAEGVCPLHYREVLEWVDADRFYMDVPFAVCLARRKARGRHGPSDTAFAMFGEGETREWVEPQRAVAGVRILDGTLPTMELVQILAARA